MAPILPKDVKQAIAAESQKFQEFYEWMEKNLPPSFFTDLEPETIFLLVHTLMGLDVQNFFSPIQWDEQAVVLSLSTPDIDLKVLHLYKNKAISHYFSFTSLTPPPFPKVTTPLRITVLSFSCPHRKQTSLDPKVKALFPSLQKQIPHLSEATFLKMGASLHPKFVTLLSEERCTAVFKSLLRAQERDTCEYEVVENTSKEREKSPFVQIVLSWKNIPKHTFLYQLAKLVYRHGLSLQRISATHIHTETSDSLLLLSIGLQGREGKRAWDVTDRDEFLQELALLKFFPGQEEIEKTFGDSLLLKGTLVNWIKTAAFFIHQALLLVDPNLYSFAHVEEGLCKHPELTIKLTEAFETKFHPKIADSTKYEALKEEFLSLVSSLDTGQEEFDNRRKNILKQGLSFVEFCLKTNFYRKKKTAFCFRLHPRYLDNIPFSREEKFPELPYAIFFMKGLHFLGYHIRFRDLARGGIRTVCPEKKERQEIDQNNLFSECYNLAYTQQKKNKDIPEGGAKGVILLDAYDTLLEEESLLESELVCENVPPEEIEKRVANFRKEQKLRLLYSAQKAYVESFLTLLNCEENGKLRCKYIVDYYQKPEYIYLGPDENMHDSMIMWIAHLSQYYRYKPGLCFMSGKPEAGINHKEFGVTSCGVHVYMEEVLKYLDIDPHQTPFTIKMSGGPDGDVAGNQMYNLYRYYPQTAKLLTTVDISGTIFDPQGLNLEVIATLFKEGKPIRFYPADLLSEGGFLLDVKTKREESPYTIQTLCLRKIKGKLIEDWLPSNEMNHILRTTVHQTKADIFIPGGGRPKTLNEQNYQEFLDETGKPTAKAIVEGANLYLTPQARKKLEDRGVIIIKDSSANKGGVICSSFEVLAGLILSEEEFIQEKENLVKEILEVIQKRSSDEAKLLLQAYGLKPLSSVSEEISFQINHYTDQILNCLDPLTLTFDPSQPLIACLLAYALPTLRKKYRTRLLQEVPDHHKKAIIASFLSQRLVYTKGLSWAPSLLDVLPLLLQDPKIVSTEN